MADPMIIAVAVEVLKYGTPLMLLAVLMALILWQYMKAMIRNSERKADKDRAEHMAKWESLIEQQREMVNLLTKTHRDEIERQFKLHERMASSLELQSAQLIKLAEKVDTNQYCPVARQKG